MSAPFSIDKNDALHILKVAGYSLFSTVLPFVALLLAQVQFPPEWLFLVPLFNTVIVGLERWAKDKSKE